MGIGLTFEEYVDLRLRPLAGADPVFSDAAERERERMFPMGATGASAHLRSRGYDCRPQMLDLLVRDGVVKLAKPDAWTQADVDAAAEQTGRKAFLMELDALYTDVIVQRWENFTGKKAQREPGTVPTVARGETQ